MSGGRLQEARKFISTASLKQLRTKCMLSLSQCCFGNRSDHWHAVIPHINSLAENKGWVMWGETERGREQGMVREKAKEREETSSKLCKCELLLQTFLTLLHNLCRGFHHFLLQIPVTSLVSIHLTIHTHSSEWCQHKELFPMGGWS